MVERDVKFTWVALSSKHLQGHHPGDLPWKSQRQEENHHRAMRRELAKVDVMVDAIFERLKAGRDFAWEWPADVTIGWCSKSMQRLQEFAKKLGIKRHDFRVEGCGFDLKVLGVPLRRTWRILTSSEQVYHQVQRGCPGHREHVDDGDVPEAGETRYPEAMRKKIVSSVVWTLRERHGVRSLAEDVEANVTEQQWFERKEQSAMALTRLPFPTEPPTGKKLEKIKQALMRIHRSSGHSSFHNVAKLLERRGAPSWAVGHDMSRVP